MDEKKTKKPRMSDAERVISKIRGVGRSEATKLAKKLDAHQERELVQRYEKREDPLGYLASQLAKPATKPEPTPTKVAKPATSTPADAKTEPTDGN